MAFGPYRISGNTLIQVGLTDILSMLLVPRAFTLLPPCSNVSQSRVWWFFSSLFFWFLAQSGLTPGVSRSVRSCLLFATIFCDLSCFSVQHSGVSFNLSGR